MTSEQQPAAERIVKLQAVTGAPDDSIRRRRLAAQELARRAATDGEREAAEAAIARLNAAEISKAHNIDFAETRQPAIKHNSEGASPIAMKWDGLVRVARNNLASCAVLLNCTILKFCKRVGAAFNPDIPKYILHAINSPRVTASIRHKVTHAADNLKQFAYRVMQSSETTPQQPVPDARFHFDVTSEGSRVAPPTTPRKASSRSRKKPTAEGAGRQKRRGRKPQSASYNQGSEYEPKSASAPSAPATTQH